MISGAKRGGSSKALEPTPPPFLHWIEHPRLGGVPKPMFTVLGHQSLELHVAGQLYQAGFQGFLHQSSRQALCRWEGGRDGAGRR